jgi:DNA topoisomerase IA
MRGGRTTFCVAEKPSVAKAIAEILSKGQFRKVRAI